MSRHPLEVRADQPTIGEAFIGWDRPMRTFFVQVYATRDGKAEEDDDDLVLWRGTGFGEIAHAGAAIALVQPFAVVPEALAVALEREREESASIADTPLQVAMRGLLTTSSPQPDWPDAGAPGQPTPGVAAADPRGGEPSSPAGPLAPGATVSTRSVMPCPPSP